MKLTSIGRQAGFTLIEVLIASAILAVATGAVVNLSRTALRSQQVAIERVQAYHLASETIEQLRQMRDSTAIDGIANIWSTPFVSASGTTHIEWDPTGLVWKLTSGAETVVLGSGTRVTTFTRGVTFPSLPSLGSLLDENGQVIPNGLTEHARRAVVTIQWESNGRTWSVTAGTILSDWRGGTV